MRLIMNNKIKKAIIILGLIILLIILIWFLTKDSEVEFIEYTPVEEITEEQSRQTMVKLYFKNKETGDLDTETRLIDVKNLANNPYEVLVKMLIEGPKNEKLERLIPEDTNINKVEIQKNVVIIDFFEGFIKNHPGGLEEESKTIYSIVNTLTELTEVDGVKILIDGEEGKAFLDGAINFKEVFVKK